MSKNPEFELYPSDDGLPENTRQLLERVSLLFLVDPDSSIVIKSRNNVLFRYRVLSLEENDLDPTARKRAKEKVTLRFTAGSTDVMHSYKSSTVEFWLRTQIDRDHATTGFSSGYDTSNLGGETLRGLYVSTMLNRLDGFIYRAGITPPEAATLEANGE